MSDIKRNERDWAGQLISWLKEAISKGQTSFEDATNDTSVRMNSGRTKFPDILLFSNKTSGLIFNGWELKFPDTAVDDAVMLDNALEKAKKLKSDSFVTWNGAEAIIWKIDTDYYSIDTLTVIKHYPKVQTIQERDDLADPAKYAYHEQGLKERAFEILHDLDMLRHNGELKEAIDVSGNIIKAIKSAQRIIVPQFTEAIAEAVGSDRTFRNKFNQWKIYESSTLKILGYSSRKAEIIDAKQVLATFTFYNVIGKILFYLTLSENLPAELPTLHISNAKNLQNEIESYFDKAKAIDYQAIFMPYFTDSLRYSEIVCNTLYRLIETLTELDFKILPTEVVGTILENLVPDDEKQKLGQYFTPEYLANIVAFPAVADRNSFLIDPTSGTGTFLHSFYNILTYFGNTSHPQKLNQIWGNDISHFPAILSVINLYKQDVTQTDNFPRVIRDDFFNLFVGKQVSFPKPTNHQEHYTVDIPEFDGIASNFPFIQQEDIPNDKLTAYFKEQFENTQEAFVKEGEFHINERADYFAYCVYNSIRFLKEGGVLSAITSNAWLGKEYGDQFKEFLLNNFHIKYIVKSTAEHWFKDSQVSTIYFVVEKCNLEEPTKFISLNFKLSEFFDEGEDITSQLFKIEELYSYIDNSNPQLNPYWREDNTYPEKVISTDGKIDIVTVDRETLENSVEEGFNWAQFFIAKNPLGIFNDFLIPYHPNIFKVIRGERTGWNPMFVIQNEEIPSTHIDPKFLVPYVKKPEEFDTIEFSNEYQFSAFVCSEPLEDLDRGTRNWINRFIRQKNTNGSQTIPEACAGHKPYWYSINPKAAHIVTAINPYERFFFTFSHNPFIIDQRMIAMQVQEGVDVELIAALLNSIVTFLTLELKGTSRNLGVLDLNANYLKELKLLNPALISEENKALILEKFQPLKNRDIGIIFEELRKPERVEFDRAILRAYGINEDILPSLYNLMLSSVEERVSMKNK